MKRKDHDVRGQDHDQGRRNFLRAAAVSGMAAGAATTSVDAVAGIAPEAPAEAEEKGYRLTEHVKAYYESFNR